MRINGLRPIVLLAAGISLVAGVGLQAISGQVDGVGWLGLAIGVGGLALLGLWWWAGRPEPAGPPKPPGVWYPLVLCGIVVLQFVWLVLWRKFW